MTRLRAVLAAAAALVLGGTALSVALRQAGQAEGLTCAEWCTRTAQYNAPDERHTFYIAFPSGTNVPEAHADRILGACSGGTCTVEPASCEQCAVSYPYELSPAVQGYRLAEIHAPPYIARGWKLWAQDTAGVRWYGSHAEVRAACLAHFTGAQCRDLLRGDERCWRLADGTRDVYGWAGDPATWQVVGTEPYFRCCRYGLLACEPTVSGLNGTACPYAQAIGPMDCVSYRGPQGAELDAQHIWTDEELDQ